MRVTSKGQVTIPQPLREKLGIGRDCEVDFVEEGGRVYLVKSKNRPATAGTRRFRRLRGAATVSMTTDEIMALTRGG